MRRQSVQKHNQSHCTVLCCRRLIKFIAAIIVMFLIDRLSPAEELREEVYEVDADPDRIDEQMTRSQADTITKQGFLLKGPDTSSDRMFAHIGSKSFKRR